MTRSVSLIKNIFANKKRGGPKKINVGDKGDGKITFFKFIQKLYPSLLRNDLDKISMWIKEHKDFLEIS